MLTMKRIQHFLSLFVLLLLAHLGHTQVTVWPGDVNNNGIVNEVDFLQLGFGYGEIGPARKDVSIAFSAQPSGGIWVNSAVEGFDLAFADCNGDGMVDSSDVVAIDQNYGLTHDDVVFIPDLFPQGVEGVNPAFSVPDDQDLTITPATEQLKIGINLGSEVIPVTGIVGISFHIKADPQVVSIEEGAFELDGWLPEEQSVVFQKKIQNGRSLGEGDLIVAYTKTNGVSEVGNGLIGAITLTPTLGFIFEDDVPNFKVTIDSIHLIDNQNNITPVLGTDIIFTTDGFRDSTFLQNTICQGESFSFNNAQITTPDTYIDTLQNRFGRDSIVILDLAVLDTAQTTNSAMICQGDSFAFGSASLTITGNYRDTLQNVNGCDSILVLDLVVLDSSQTVNSAMICQGESFAFGGASLTIAGNYRDTLQNVNGCDSILVLDLAVLDTAQTVNSAMICQGDSFAFGGASLTIAGNYRDTLQLSLIHISEPTRPY